MITLHQFEISPFCDKIRRVLQYKRLPYRVREVPLTQTLSLKKINPAGKVPCIEHEGRYVGDSTDIAHYLEDKFPERPLVPKDARLAAQCHVLEDWADETLYFFEMYFRFGLSHNAERWVPELAKGTPGIVQAAARGVVPLVIKRTLGAQGLGKKRHENIARDLERHLDAVAGWLGEGDWLVGDTITLADISVFAQLFCVRGAREGAQAIASRSAVARWMDRVDRETGPQPGAETDARSARYAS
jgi:glutathione S-transferase